MVTRRDLRSNSNRNSTRHGNLTLHIESLESRQLLAGDFVNGVSGVSGIDGASSEVFASSDTQSVDAAFLPADVGNDPFSRSAFPLAELVERTVTTPYVPGELTVALRYDARAVPESGFETGRITSAADSDVAEVVAEAEAFSRTLTTGFWQSVLPEYQVTDSAIAVDYSRQIGEQIVLVDLEFDPRIDPAEIMSELANDPYVVWSSPTFRYDVDAHGDPRDFISNDPQSGEQYHHALIQNDLAWDITLGDSSIIVAITDDGVSATHSDLAPNVWENVAEIPGDQIDNDLNGYIDDVSGWDFVDSDADSNPAPGDTHGTHVAGIVGGRTDNGVGIAGTAGRSTVLPIRFYDQQDPGAWTNTVIRDSFMYAVDNGARIVNTSYNIDSWVGDPVFTAGLQYIHDSGALHFNSAGNRGAANPDRQAFTQSILVANTNVIDQLASSSNYGTGIDIAAPGTGILSTVPANAYDRFSGTSMAAPNAAGVAALIWAQNPEWSSYQVAHQLFATADNIDAANPGFVGLLGAGRVNSYAALTATPDPVAVTAVYGLPADGGELEDVTTTQFSVQFDNVTGFDSTNDIGNYELRNAGADELFDTEDDEIYSLAITSQYMLAAGEVELEVIGSQLEPGLHRLRVSNGLVDPFDQAIDGDGDGVAGGKFETMFEVTTRLSRSGPLPGFIAQSLANTAAIRSASDVDRFGVVANAGETVSVIVSPADSLSTVTVELVDSEDDIVRFEEGLPGEPVFIPTTSLTESGEYFLQVTADVATEYEYAIVKNANIDSLIDSPTAVAIDDSAIEVGGVSRFAAVGFSTGSSPEPFHSKFNDPNLFIDISDTGTEVTLSGDGLATIQTTVGNSLFPSGDATISNDGVLISGAIGDSGFQNSEIPNQFWGPALAPFWDDLSATGGEVYWQEVFNGATDVLIVQWNDRPHERFGNDVTFQIQLFDSGPTLARFAYDDVVVGTGQANNGASATVGYQWSGTGGRQVSRNTASVFDGDVINITESASFADTDRFTIDLVAEASSTIDIGILADRIGDYGSIELSLIDPFGETVATGLILGDPNANFDSVIAAYDVQQSGEYTIEVNSRFFGEYSLVATPNALLDTEPNNTASVALDNFSSRGAVAGFLGNGETVLNSFNDPSAFIDISTTGQPLGLTDDGEANITLPFGNSLVPSGDYTVSNNGVLALGAHNVSGLNRPLPTDAFDLALIPFWDDLDGGNGDVYWEQVSIDGEDAVIVQWENRPHFSVGEGVTFQIQIRDSDSLPVRYAYKDVRLGNNAFNDGSSATIGFQTAWNDAVTFSHNSVSVSDGDVIDVLGSDRDIFRVEAIAGENVLLQTATPLEGSFNQSSTFLDPTLTILDANGSPMLTDESSAADGRNAQLLFAPETDGTYYVMISSEVGGGEYTLRSIVPDGDFDDDEQFACSDIDALGEMVVGGSYDALYDLNLDGLLDGQDVDEWLALAGLANGHPAAFARADANLDGVVDGSDFNIWNQNKFTQSTSFCSGDFNTDGAVDGSDFNIWNQNKFTSINVPAPVVTPSPIANAGLSRSHIDSIFSRYDDDSDDRFNGQFL